MGDNSILEPSKSDAKFCFNLDLAKWNIFHICSADNLEQMVQWLKVRELAIHSFLKD